MFSKSIFESFPPPGFLNIPFSGMSISDSAVRVIKFKKSNKRLSIEKYSEKYLTQGTITGGQINNKEELIKVITEIKNDLGLDYVKVSLSEEKGYLFTTKIPLVEEIDIKSAIESKIEENVPVPPGELIFDFKIKENKEKDRLDVVVSALPISVVETYVEVIQNAGLEMLSLEIESQAIARTLIEPHDKKTVLIIHFGQGKAGLYVVVNRVVHFTSTIQFRSDSAESADQLSQEIKRLYAYWHTLKENVGREERKISEIIVCGESVSENTISYISTHNQTKVSLGNVWTNVLNVDEKVPEIAFADSLKFTASVGLALPSKSLI